MSKTRQTPSMDQKLKSLGLIEPMDFLLHLPFRYEDNTHLSKVQDLVSGERALLEGRVENIQIRYVRPGLKILTAELYDDEGGVLSLEWFNFYPSQVKMLESVGRIRVAGEVQGSQWGFKMAHPKLIRLGTPLETCLTPIYHTTKGLTQEVLRRVIMSYVDRVPLPETLPESIVRSYDLMPIGEAVRYLHHPPKDMCLDDTGNLPLHHPAFERVKLDELVAQQLALAQARQEREQYPAFDIEPKSQLADDLMKEVGFTLTSAQKRVCQEILHDMYRGVPMLRLLQGDVGSGKTVVAAWVAAQVVENGYQVAVMAPTEILAAQHFEKFHAWFSPLGVEVVWLSGSQKASEKKQIIHALSQGHAQIVVGTQAIIQQGVSFHRLALVISDEQHRFGVGQRLALLEKGVQQEVVGLPTYPHQLSMSATPIPRSLAMSYFSDMQVSVIDELPPGRTPVVTKLIATTRRNELIRALEQHILSGEQIYWVCPLVEESDKLQLQAAQKTYEQLQQELPGLRVGLVHGRLKTDEKDAVMQAFRMHKLDVLVATTVIEVGVDVPSATLMVIEHAERFGLAQLHQLRGRVGRGSGKSTCVLLYGEQLSAEAKFRLKVMYEHHDGFIIAQKDLELRGPGEMLGLRQSGIPSLRFANLIQDSMLVEQARDIAEKLMQYPEHMQRHVERWIADRSQYLRS